MLQDAPPPVNPKETSLMTHSDASIKMYDISIGFWLGLTANAKKWDLLVRHVFFLSQTSLQ